MRFRSRLLLALGLVAAAGCGRHQTASLLGLPNQPPVVALTGRVAGAADAGLSSYDLAWTAYDPDGRVERVEITDDLRVLSSAKASWRTAGATSERLSLRSRRLGGDAESTRGDLSVFAVRAVDDRHAVSAPAIRAFFGENVAPMVQIVSPSPDLPQIWRYLPPSFHIRWEGSDPDGPNGRPTRYAYRLFSRAEPEFQLLLSPELSDSVRHLYAPDFPGWAHVPGDSTTATFIGLENHTEYVFAVVAFDEQGAYTPFFSRSSNVLHIRVLGRDIGPSFRVTSRFFQIDPPPSQLPVYEYPADATFEVTWKAEAYAYSEVAAYRWALDPDSLRDQRSRHGKGPEGRWSEWSLAETTATIGPFHGPEASKEHRLVLEAADDLGRISQLVIRMKPVRMTLQRPLLIVDDTRFLPTDRPVGPWPNAAELDTFLFARGSVPWSGRPAGTLSPPGVFAGYSFDTLGTRTGRDNLTVPLEVLSRYRQVIWIADPASATNLYDGANPTEPLGALRYMCRPGHVNTLAAYLSGGGRVWLVGSSGYASMADRDKVNNNAQATTLSFANGELLPGTLMYDLAHWRSEFRSQTLATTPLLLPGVSSRTPPATLPAHLTLRRNGTDPIPYGRTASMFFLSKAPSEHLSLPNAIVEDVLPQRGRTRLASVLDTVYRVVAPGSSVALPCMTVYRGSECGEVVHSGFDLWSWRHTDCVALVDGVLQGLWGMTKGAASSGGLAQQTAEEPAVRPRPRR